MIAIISGLAVAALLVLLVALSIAPSSLEYETETAVIWNQFLEPRGQQKTRMRRKW